MHLSTDVLRNEVKAALGGESKTGLALSAGLPREAITSFLSGHEPRFSRAIEICRAVGLDLEILPREGRSPDLPPDTESYRWGDRRGQEVTSYEVPMRDGHAPERVGFSPNGCASFGLDFLLSFDLNPKLCEVIEFHDDAMAPEFPAGAAGLVDLRRRERVDGWVYVLDAPGLTVRRARETPNGWVAAPDNPEFQASPWTGECRVIGKVVWTSHMVDTEPAVAG